MAIMLVTVPLYLKVLGNARYGVLALVWLLLGYFSVLEMGLGKATANHVARLHDASSKERSEIFWTALFVNACLGTLGALILWGIGEYLLTGVLKIPQVFQDEATEALPWMIVTLPLALVSSVLNGALEGRNCFLIANILQVISNVVFLVVPLVTVYLYGPSLAVVIPAAVLSRTLMNIPFLVACYANVPLTLRPIVTMKAAKPLFSYGGWIALTGMAGPLLDTIDRFLIGVFLGPQAVTHYTVPMQLVSKTKIIPSSLSRALFPKFAAGSHLDAYSLALNALHMLTMVMTPLIVCGIVLLRPFMQYWVGDDIAAISAPLGEIFFFGVWVNSLAHIPYFLLQGKGRPDIVAKLHVAEIVPFLCLLWGLMHLWGIYGAIVAWTIRVMLEAGLLFSLSSMPKTALRTISGPAIMIIIAIITAHGIADQSWVWRFGFATFSMIWVGWYIYSKGYGTLSKLIAKDYAAR